MKEGTEKDQPTLPPIAMTSPLPTPSQLLEENEELRTRLEQAEEMLRAIRSDDGAALTLHSTSAPQVSTPQGQDTAANRFRGEMLAQVNDAVIAVDEHDRINCFNAAAERLYGVTAANALGSSMAEIYQVRWLQPGDEAAAAAGLREHGEWHGEVAHVRHDGCDLSVEASITMLCDHDGRETGRIAVIRDVAERRLSHNRMMLSEMRYRRLFEAARDGVLILDPVTRKIIDANPFMTQLLGYSHDQLIGRELYEIGFLADAQASREMFQTLKTTRQVRYENLPLQARQGGRRDVEVVANLYDEDGNIVVQCNVRDITERRRAETKLEERQNFLAHIFEVLPGVLYVFDMDENRVVFVNNTGALTFSPEEVAGMGADLVQNLMHPDDQPRFQEHLARMRTLNPGETAAFEYRMRDRADEWRWYMGIDAVYLRDESGVARQIIGIAPEITERKRVELALQVSEQRFRTLIEATSAVTWSCAPSGQLIEFQPQWSDFTGQSASEMLDGGHATAFHPDDAEYAWARWADAVARDAPYHNELRIRRHDGEWRWMRVHCVPVHQDGTTVEWFGMCIDITERKVAEKTLKDLESRQRLILETCQIGTYHGDLKSGEATWNSVEFQLLGLSEGDAPPARETFYKYVHPDDVVSLKATWDAGMEDREQDTEFRVIRADGEERWLAVRGANYPEGKDEQGQPHQRYFGVNFDVTDRKRIELALRDSETRLSRILEQSPAGIVQADADGRVVLANARWCEMLGYSETEMVGMTIIELTHPSSIEATSEAVGRLAKGGPDFRIDKNYRRKDGAMLQVNSNVAALRDAQGNYGGLLAVVIDLTERYEAEAKLRAAHDTFRHLVDRSPFGIYAVDADFRLAQVSDGAQKVFENVPSTIGRDLAEVLRILWPEPFASEAIAHFRHTLATGEAYTEEVTEQRADIAASEAYDWKLERITMPDGRFGVVCHFYDLSDRKRHEEHAQLLMAEVNHRAKNLLSVVQAVAQQTAKSGDPMTFAARLSDRIGGLATHQDLLVKNLWEGVGAGELVTSQLAHFKDLIGTRIHLTGPVLMVTAAASQAIGMAVHELATNAAKYGALSNSNGQVQIEWQLSSGPKSLFLMSWRESDGPQVKAPTRTGFGQTVLKRLVEASIDGNVKVDYAEDGFSWHLRTAAKNVLVMSGRA